MKRPRLLFVLYSHNTWGGIEVWLHGLVRGLSVRGWDVAVALARGARHNDPAAFRAAYPDVETLEADGRTGTDEGRIRAIRSVIRRFAPDVVLPVAVAHALAAAGREKERGADLRLVTALHAISAELLADARAFAPVLDLCVGVNPLQIEWLEAGGHFAPGRLAAIPNGTPRPAGSAERTAPDPLEIAYVGRLDADVKRVLDLPVLATELRGLGARFRLTVVGSGPAEADLRAAVVQRGLGDVMTLAGYLPHAEIGGQVLARSHALVITSSSEAAPPLASLEAMSWGVVPVSSEFVGVHSPGSLVHGRTALLFPCGDLTTAARHLHALQREPGLLARISAEARSRASSFALAACHDAWDRALRDAVSRPPAIPRPGESYPFQTAIPSGGRLERIGVSPLVADSLRRRFHRFPRFEDGWGEWPGTLSTVEPSARAEMLGDLARLDARARELSR